MAEPADKQFGPVGTFVRDTVRAIVDHPDDVRVWETIGGSSVMVEFAVHAEDVGQVLGAGGDHIHALTALACAVGGRTKKRVLVERRAA